jgi:hypothetical protein
MSNLYLVNTPNSVRTIQSGVDSTTRVVRSNFPSGSTPLTYRRTRVYFSKF